MHGAHGGFASGPETREPRSQKAELIIGKVSSFIVEKLGKAITSTLYGPGRFGSEDKPTDKNQSTAPGSQASTAFGVIAIPRQPSESGEGVEISGGSFPEDKSVVLHGVEKPDNPELN